jgi:hypothetical protein
MSLITIHRRAPAAGSTGVELGAVVWPATVVGLAVTSAGAAWLAWAHVGGPFDPLQALQVLLDRDLFDPLALATFLGPFSAVCNQFRPRRHRLTASDYRHIRAERHVIWLDVALAGVRP